MLMAVEAFSASAFVVASAVSVKDSAKCWVCFRSANPKQSLQRGFHFKVRASAQKEDSSKAKQDFVMRSRRRGQKRTPTDPEAIVRYIVKGCEQKQENLTKLLQKNSRVIQLEECFLLFDALGRKDKWVQTLEVFRWMQQQTWYRPDNGVYSKLISIIGKKGQIRVVMWVFSQMRKIGCRPDTSVYNALIQAHLHGKDKQKSLAKAFDYLEIMKNKPRCQPNIVTYNILLRACAQNCQVDKVDALLTEIKLSNIVADNYTYNGVMDAYGKNGMLREMEDILSRMKEDHCRPDIITFNLLIDAYGKHQEFNKMEKVFESLLRASEQPTASTFNSMIISYGKARLIDKVESTRDQMTSFHCKPSSITFDCLMMAYGLCGNVIKARELFSEMRSRGATLQLSSLHALLDAYCRNGYLEEADLLLHNASAMGIEPRVSTYKLLFRAYMKSKEQGLIDRLLKSMSKNGVIPNKKFMEALESYASDRSNENKIHKRIDFSSVA
eukprot:TRINITY_DN9553_c0_g1_i1.p1 TRINITY_DN9553_c0_g1~~TRINITY_DN9553_c0_g1_i1.p1  ORF type:complete len:497 (+),score=78.47 TRINITY_DN9553_c0_g1_i1:290-1780(+)